MPTVYYLAYGSNMDAERMNDRGAKFTERRWGKLSGYILKFNKIATGNKAKKGEGKGNIVLAPEGIVEGALYTISEDGLEKLDDREIGYNRDEVPVEVEDGTQVKAWTYVADADMTAEGLKPTKEYFAHYLKGKDLLSREYFLRLQAVQTLD